MEVEAFPIGFTRGIRSYWGKRKYQRLDAANGKTTRGATQQLGGARRAGGGGGGGWGLRLRRLLRVRVRVAKAVLSSPVRLLARIRDAYVGGMLAVSRKASAMALPNAPEGLWPRRVPRRKQLPAASRPGQLSDFEQRLVVEIYKSIVASKELTTMLHHSTAHLPQHHNNTAPSSQIDLLSN